MEPYIESNITFSIENYVLGKDVRSSLKRQVTYAKQYAHHALLIMNNFGAMRRGRVWNWWNQCIKICFLQSTPLK